MCIEYGALCVSSASPAESELYKLDYKRIIAELI